jgi:FtsP/CotA-like multicopper oxidase with cupredoxin domain
MRVLLRYGGDRRALRAFRERQEMVKAGLTRRDLVKMGLITGGGVGGGLLVTDKGVAASGPGSLGTLPPLRPFVQPLTVLPVLTPRAESFLSPAPTIGPNRYKDAANGNLPFEGRTEPHQSRDIFPAKAFFVTRMAANPNAIVHPDLPPQTFWGFNTGEPDLTKYPAMSPGPVLVARYGTPFLVRRYNQLPPPEQNGGFGVPEVSTHLHNFHSGPDSDGGPCDPGQQRFFFRGQYYDYFHNAQFAGWNSTNPYPDPNPAANGVRGNVQEALGLLWYHDHRVDHTAENTYKGLVGPCLMFNAYDTGDESKGLHLPGFSPDPKQTFDIPLVLADRFFDPTTGLLALDSFNTDGVLGNVFLVNGKAQPFCEVQKRRYRFRILNGGPSRFYEIYLTNPDNLSQSIPFLAISSDGNLLPRPIQTLSDRLAVAERTDILVDFAKIAKQFGATRLRLENRLEQVHGKGPTGKILPAGQGDQLLEFRLVGGAVDDGSFDYEPLSSPNVPAKAGDAVFAPISLPDISGAVPRITRTFRFERGGGGWQVNGQFMDCTRFRFTTQVNAFERWIIQNNSGGWQHPIHIHLEEFRILSRNGVPVRPGNIEFGRKDVLLLADEQIELLVRFRDMKGGYPIHCHNTVHEDHQMMLLFNVQDKGDNNTRP